MKILIAVDGSDHSNAAVRFLTQLQFADPIEASLVTVSNPPDIALNAASEFWYPEYLTHQQEFTDAAFTKAIEILADSGIKAGSETLRGHIGDAIVKHASDIDADLVIVGAKGHTAVGRILLGSVSDYVATHAPCDVLVVRPMQSDAEHLKLTLAYDESDASESVLDAYWTVNWQPETDAEVVTAAPKLEIFHEEISPTTEKETQQRLANAQATAESGKQALIKACEGTPHKIASRGVATEHIGEGLLHAAEDHSSDLIILGDAKRGTLTRWLLGSTSRYVLRHATQSIWIAR